MMRAEQKKTDADYIREFALLKHDRKAEREWLLTNARTVSNLPFFRILYRRFKERA